MPKQFVPSALLSVVPLAVETDRGMLDIYERSLDYSPTQVVAWPKNLSAFYKAELSVKPRKRPGQTDCWELQVSDSLASLAQARKAQIAVCKEIGMWPSMLYEYLKEYDSSFDSLYSQYVRANCSYMNPYCIRPGHMRPCNMNMGTFRTLMGSEDFETLRRIRIQMRLEKMLEKA